MKLIVHGHRLKITPAIKAYAEKKIKKLDEYFEGIIEAVLELEVQKIKNKDLSHTAKLILHLPKHTTLRGEERTSDIYAAIDNLVDKMSKPLKKQHDRLKNAHKKNNFFSGFKKMIGLDNLSEDKENIGVIIKKEPPSVFKPMDPVEAVLQLNKAKKDFIVFNNTKTHHQISIVYDRKNGTYGLQTFKDMYMKRAKIKKFEEMPAGKKYEGNGVKITKIKELKVDAMSPIQAAQKLIENKQFVFNTFTNTENNKVCVLYRKNNNTYGLIEPYL